MAKNKYYVVWVGHNPGVYSNWNDCKAQVDSYFKAQYKGFATKELAEAAFKAGPGNNSDTQYFHFLADSEKPVAKSICVDAACSGNPGKMEYKGVFTETKTELFKVGVFEDSSNNIGEFLALVHGLAWLKTNNLDYIVYSDSQTAISWVKAGKNRSKLKRTSKNVYMFQLVARAENWLKENKVRNEIRKWKTELWGEIPADFGRK